MLKSSELVNLSTHHLHLLHHTQPIATPHLFKVVNRKAFSQEATRKVNQFTGVGTTHNTTVAVKVSANAYVVNTRYVYHVKQVTHGIVKRCWYTLLF